MPQLDLTELEAKVLWLILDTPRTTRLPGSLGDAEDSLFVKAYRLYRGYPPKEDGMNYLLWMLL
jgi:hypothetical protein